MSVTGKWEHVHLEEFHATVMGLLARQVGCLLEQDIAHMNLCASVPVFNEFDFISEEKDLIPPAGNDDYEKSVRQYMKILKNYVSVNVTIDQPDNLYCPDCLCQLQLKEHSLFCETCPYSIMNELSSAPIEPSINAAHEMKNFQETLGYFMGTTPITAALFSNITQQLDGYFKGMNFPLGQKIRRRKVLACGRRRGTTRMMMLKALKSVKVKNKINTSLGNYVNHFMIHYWGWKQPDIAEVKSTLVSNHKRLLTVMARLLAKYKRRTIIGQWIMLEEHLNIMGVKLHPHYFKAHKTEGVVELHREIVNKAFCLAGIV